MTVNSASIGAAWFLNGLARLQSQEILTQQQLDSGYAVSSAADNPAAAGDLVDLGSSLAAAKAYQSNLGSVQAEASAADTSIGSAIALIQSALSIGEQGANSNTSANTRQTLALQIQGIQQQIVALADTQVAGKYIFGGDRNQTAPYQYDATGATGVDALSTSPSTRQIVNPSGVTVYQSLTAAQIFDPSANGAPSAANTFAALANLETALTANDTTGIANALTSLQSASDWLNQNQAYYGTAEQRLASEQNSVSAQIASMETQISGIRDANVAQDATDLTQESTDQQAAMSAEAAMPQKSLFDYLG
jgi:flagellar hook-associated protein 3 FlgL